MADAPPTDRTAPPAPPREAKNSRVRLGLSILAAVALIAGAIAGERWLVHGRFIESTDDAYLNADFVTVAPRISGYVDAVYVVANQKVTAGQPLLRVDARNYQAVLSQENATLDARAADINAAQNQVSQQQALVSQDEAQLAGAQANLRFTQQEAERYKSLFGSGVETRERYDQALNERDQAEATAGAAAAGVLVARRQLTTLKSQLQQVRAQLEAARATVRTARLNLDDTLVRASISGRIGDDTVRLGEYVQPGTRLMSIVPVQDVYLVANFKETQLQHMRVGQAATIQIDALDQTIDGRIESFSPGTGAQFALLPPENATGNFIKIVQRVPVRIRLLAPPGLADRLLPGLSATAWIDTRQTGRPM